MDISFKTEAGKFNYRVIFLITNTDCDKFLMYSDEGIDFWVPFGGRAKLGELSSESVDREIIEELGDVKIASKKLIASAENMFTEKSKPFHELSFIHHVVIDDSDELINQQGICSTIEDNTHIQKWFSLDELSEHKVFPLFLPDIASDLLKNKFKLTYNHYIADERN